MKIGINGFEAVVPRFGYDKEGRPKRVGSSEICFQLITEFAKIDSKNEYIIYLPKAPTDDLPKETARLHYKIMPGSMLWTVTGLTMELLKRPQLDVFFSPTHYGPLFTPCPEVISILDVSYKYYPALFKKKDLYQLATWGKYSVRHAKKIITISNSSKNDIIREYRVKGDKIAVVYPGIKELSQAVKYSDIEAKYKIKKPYILFVGTLQPRKNIVRLVEAFSKISGTAFELLIIGHRGWNFEETLASPKKFEVEGRVRILETVTDEELPAFYENAHVFVLPSLYEGFGLPILEAMKYGCPVVTSNVSSMPEAGGDAALYFDPENVEDIRGKIEKVLKDSALRLKMIRDGYVQVKKFSWEKAARDALSVFEEIGRRPGSASGQEGGKNV